MMLHKLSRGATFLGALVSFGIAEGAWAQEEEPVPFEVNTETPIRVEPGETAEPLRMLAQGETVDVLPSAPMSAGFVQVTTRGDNLEGWTSTSYLSLPGMGGFYGNFIGADQEVQILVPPGYLQAPAQPTVQAFSDGINWLLREPLIYEIMTSNNAVEVPRGFVTDFATIPWRYHWLIRSTGAYSAAAVVHDFLYWTQICTRGQADRLFRLAMEESGVSILMRNSMYLAVRFAGEHAWNENQRNRKADRIRVVPEPYDTVPPRTKWDAYRSNLEALNVVEPQYALPTPAACAYGN